MKKTQNENIKYTKITNLDKNTKIYYKSHFEKHVLVEQNFQEHNFYQFHSKLVENTLYL